MSVLEINRDDIKYPTSR
nr:unnamed protein product [Callosobruchus analis]